MEPIKDYKVYLDRMDASLIDKCWWVDKIPDDIDTVVDFGCAAGHLKKALDVLCPNRFRYIGIEVDNTLYEACVKSGIEVYSTMANTVMKTDIDLDHTVLVMNSVIHELLTYDLGAWTKLKAMNILGFKYIAIRDMHIPPEHCQMTLPTQFKLIERIKESPYGQQWNDFCKVVEDREKLYRTSTIAITEFLLKYRYKENWTRECYEQYLWNWSELIFKSYSRQEEQRFYIPFLKQKIYEDFKAVLAIPTHIRLLLERIDDYVKQK